MKRAFATAIVLVSAATVSASAWADAGHQHGHNAAKTGSAMAKTHGHWAAPDHAQRMSNPMAASTSSIRLGQALFQENCAACHGDDGSGNGAAAADLETAPANLIQMAPTHTDGDFAWKIANGRGEMPGWEGVLTSQEIWHVVNFLKHLPRLASIRSDRDGSSGETAID